MLAQLIVTTDVLIFDVDLRRFIYTVFLLILLIGIHRFDALVIHIEAIAL
jgi:hypothetical protein